MADAAGRRPSDGSVTGLPRILLRSEGAALLAMALTLYWQFGTSWLLFVVLLLAPDVGMLGFLRGSRAGAALYNAFHTYVPPAILAVAGVLLESELVWSLSLIWFAHIGMDRLLGYGLKYPTGFQDTHLGRIGRSAP
ncbi:MAG TPA: DUF4260 domain-containing protein [Actinomycetota bacterium]|nr:DUF4260 domain-containing protein [Actinomycetota bacterium]